MPGPPLILHQTKARRAEKVFSETDPPFLRVWMTEPSPPPPRPLSEGLDPRLIFITLVSGYPIFKIVN